MSSAPGQGASQQVSAPRQRVDRRWPMFVGPIGSGLATIGVVGMLAGLAAVGAGVVIAVGVVMAITAIIAAYR